MNTLPINLKKIVISHLDFSENLPWEGRDFPIIDARIYHSSRMLESFLKNWEVPSGDVQATVLSSNGSPRAATKKDIFNRNGFKQ